MSTDWAAFTPRSTLGGGAIVGSAAATFALAGRRPATVLGDRKRASRRAMRPVTEPPRN